MKYLSRALTGELTRGHVKAYMSGWELVEGKQRLRIALHQQEYVTVEYGFFGGNKGLSMVVVDYITANGELHQI